MAELTRANGAAQNFGAFGRTVQVLSCAKSNMTQAEVNSLVTALGISNTVSGISEFTAGTTDTLYVAVEGATIANATIAGFTVTTAMTFVAK